MRREKLIAWVRRAADDPRRADISLFAANGAYYLFLSLGPLAALLLAILPYTPLTEAKLLETVFAVVPRPLRQIISAVFRDVYAGSAAALSLSLSLELWSGARFLASVVRGVSSLYGGGKKGYLRRRIMGAAYTAVLVIFIAVNLTLLLFGERLLFSAGRRYPALSGLWNGIFRLRPAIFLIGLTAGNALLFRCAPGSAGRKAGHLPGASFAAGAWLAFSRAYSWALERFGLFGVYGSIAAAAASMCWMYGSLYILFFGAWLNVTFREERRGER